MKYMSLLALCSMLVLIPACKRCGTGCCPTTTTTTSSHTITTDGSGTIVQDVQQDKTVQTQLPQGGLDKEALEEAELVNVMTNK